MMELSRREVPLYGHARVFVLIPSLTGCEELFVLLEGSSVLHVLQTKLHTLTYFITPGHNQQETVCVRAYTYIGGVLQYVGVSFLTYVEDDGQHMAEYLVTHSNPESSDLIGQYGLSDSRARAEMDERVALALANLQTNHSLLDHTHGVESLLHVCVRLGFVRVCEFLLSQPGALMLIDSANQEGDTPLQLAQRTNRHALVHLLTHPPNPLVSPLGGVVCVQIDSAHLLRFMHPARVMSLSVCVSECVSDSQIHSAVLLLRECVRDTTLIHKITSLCGGSTCRSDQDSFISSSDDFESRGSPVSAVTRPESISSCSDAEDEEPLLSISSDVSENEPNVTSSPAITATITNTEVHQSEEEPEKTQLCAGSDSDGSRNQSEEGNKLTPSTQPGVTQKVPLKSDPVSMLLSSSHSSPALLVSGHMTSSHRRRSNSEGCGHEMTMRKSWSVIGQPPCELPAPVTLDYAAESWSAVVEPEFLRDLDRDTVKRQEVIYELMQTEFHHVQTLAVMIGVLRRGLQEEVQLEQDVIAQIFPGLDELMDVHRNFLTAMEGRRPAHTRNHVLHRVGDVLLQQFSGSCARHMMELYGEFCSKQPEALRLYKQLQQNNRKLQVFLRQQSCKLVIKRREIPEFLLLVTQRITKYPVLLERLLQHTGGGGVERDDVTAALEGVRGVISGVESHVEKIQRAQQLDDILNRLDNKSFTRLKSGEVYSKHTLLHTTHTHTLTHCSGVTCRSTSGRLRDVLALLLPDVLVFLQEKEQKFTFAALEQKPAVVPLRGLILREIANQDRGLFLISSDAAEPEMYEIHTSTREERERWISLLQSRSFPENELKNTEELKSSRVQTVHDALLSVDLQVFAVLEDKLRVCVGGTPRHLLTHPHTHTPNADTLLNTAQSEVVNLMGCVVSLIFSNHDFIQQVEEVSKKQMKWREPAALKILKVVECVHTVTQVLYSLQAAVTIQDSVYELQKLRLLQEEPGTDTDCRVEGDVLSMCSTDLERREREELEAELQLWAERSEVLKEEEAEIERERRRVQQQERQIRKEKERMKRKLRLSQQNSTNRQRSLSFIVPTDK